MRDNNTKPKIRENLTGRRYGRWTVTGSVGGRRRLWRARCDCGKTGTIGEYQLKKELSRSCGCLKSERARRTHTAHGESAAGKRSPELRAYLLAKNQCENPGHENYAKFGALGVKFKFADFSDFLAAVGRKPGRSYVLTRTDRKGNYEKGNVEWTRNKNRKL